MAKVRNPLSSEAARGKFGPVMVFSAWRTIAVVRNRVTPTNPRSTRQLAVRSTLASLSASWATLAANKAAAWNQFAAGRPKTNVFGQYFASGFNAYQELNFFRLDQSIAASDDPPTTAFLGNLSGVTVAAGSGSGEIDVAWTAPVGSSPSDVADIWITGVMPNGNRQPQETDYRHNQYVLATTETVTLSGLVPSGYYWVKARFVQADGRAGLFTQGQAAAHA